MIGNTAIGALPIGAFQPQGSEYDITASTSAPSVAMLLNMVYGITASTPVPTVAMTAELNQVMDITASTLAPAVSMTMIGGRTMEIAASTQPPTVHITMVGGLAFNITAETSSPSVVMSIIQDLVYAVTASTQSPSVLMTISAPAGTIAAGETTAWCVNLATGAHSRYTDYPDASGSSPIVAYALTGVTDFGDSHGKYVHDIYVHCRLQTEGVSITTITDEVIVRSGYDIEPCVDNYGLTRRRRRLAKGVKGQNWQFKFSNINSGSFIIKQVDVPVIRSQRRA